MEIKNSKEKEQKNHTDKRKKLSKPLIILACAAVVGLSVYADRQYSEKLGKTDSYLYNTSVSGEQAKILGEATFVGNISESETDSDAVSSENTGENYFAASAMERRKCRDESLEILQTIVDSSESMPDAKNKALSDMADIASAMESEANIETLIKAKGFEDCVAVVNGENVNVIVKSAGLLTYEVAQIKEIVMNELMIPAENIKIIEKAR